MRNSKRLLLTLVFVLAAQQLVAAQSNTAQGSAAPAAMTAEQSAKLAEATRLTAEAVKLHGQGKFDEALPLAERALALRTEAVGQEHQSVAASLRNLGAIQLAKGKADKGRQLYTRALAIYEKNQTGNETNIYKLLDALGLLERFAFNNFTAAIERYERSLALKESKLGAEHEEVVKTLYELAELYELLAYNDKALAIHRRVVAVREKYEAKEPYDLVRALNRYKCLTERLKMSPETAEAEQRVEVIEKREEERRERDKAEREKAPKAEDATVRGGVINGKAISKPPPVYPDAAKRSGISGVVTIYVTVDESGRVIEAYPCGHPLLSEAAVRAAYAARFSATLLSGQPVKVNGSITYNFVLR